MKSMNGEIQGIRDSKLNCTPPLTSPHWRYQREFSETRSLQHQELLNSDLKRPAECYCFITLQQGSLPPLVHVIPGAGAGMQE